MARTAFFLAAAIALSGFASQASAAPCRDAAGKFTACPTVAKGPCRNAAGKFIKCTATAKPAGVTTTAAKVSGVSTASAKTAAKKN